MMLYNGDCLNILKTIANIKPKKEMVKMNNGETNLRIRKLTPLEL